MTQESRLSIVIDSKNAKVNAEEVAKTIRDLESAGFAATKSNAQLSGSMNRMASEADAAARAIKRGLVAALGGLSAMSVIDVADEWGQYASRIRMATKSAEEYEHVQKRMVKSAQATFRAINETRESFIQMSPILRDMGFSLDQSIDAVDAFSGLLVVNGANAERGAAAMNALSKSLQRGKVDVESWMTIYTTADTIIDSLAESTGRAAEEIRTLGSDGKITAEMLARALVEGNEKILKAVDGMPTTVRDAMQNINTAFGEYIGRTNEANQVTATLAEGLGLLGNNLEGVLNVAIVAAGAGLTAYSAKTTLALVETGKLTAAKIAEAAASRNSAIATEIYAKARLAEAQATVASATGMQRLTLVQTALIPAQRQLEAATKAVTVANRGLGASLLGLVGGPIGGITLAAGLAATAFFTLKGSTDESAEAFDDLGKTLEELTGKWRALTVAQNEALRGQYTLQESVAATALTEAKKSLDTALAQMGGGFSGGFDQLESFVAKINEAGEDTAALVAVLREAETAGVLSPDAAQSVIDYASAQDDAAQAHQKAQSVLEQHLQFMKEFSGELKSAAAAQNELNDALVQTRSEWLTKYATQAERLTAELEKAKEAFGGVIPPDIEKRIREAFSRKGRSSVSSRDVTEIQRVTKALQEQFDTLGMNEYELARYRIETTKSTKVEKEYALSILEQVEARKEAYLSAERFKTVIYQLYPERRAAEELAKQLGTLAGALDAGTLAADGYNEALKRAIEQSLEKMPDIQGLSVHISGGDAELERLEREETRLNEWYEKQMTLLAEFREKKSELNAEWDERERQLKEQHETGVEKIEHARQVARLSSTQSMFSNLSEAAKVFAGEQSGIYRALFAAEKAYAVAKLIMNAPKTASDAYSAVVGIPVIGPTLAPAAAAAALAYQAAQVASVRSVGLTGMAHDGIDSVPKTGTWLLEKGERVMTADTSARMDALFDRLDSKKSALKETPKPPIVNIYESSERAGQVESRYENEQYILSVFVNSVRSGTQAHEAIAGAYGLQRVGR